jgi:hypothetical protein
LQKEHNFVSLIWILNKKVLVGITLCKNLYWKLIRYISLQHFLRIRKYIDQSAMSIPSISSHFRTFWMWRWVNVFSKVIYANFKLFVFISLSKKPSFGWKCSVLILSMLSYKHILISVGMFEIIVYSNITSFFRFTNQRAIYRLGIVSLAHAPVHVTDFPVVNIPVDILSSARIGQHRLFATLSANASGSG